MKALHFSGGIDSLALLWLMRAQWPELHVFWLNSGAAYPQTVAYMARIRHLVPHFHEVLGAQPFSIRHFGWPVDAVPVHATREGRALHGTAGRVFQSYLQCCSRSLWEPMRLAMAAHSVTDVYRGQRQDDRRKAPVRSGVTDEFGVTYHFPLEDWTREQVFAYCRSECPDLIPDYYAAGEASSRDCWNCTAYLDDNVARIRALPPQRRVIVLEVLRDWRAEVDRTMEVMK